MISISGDPDLGMVKRYGFFCEEKGQLYRADLGMAKILGFLRRQRSASWSRFDSGGAFRKLRSQTHINVVPSRTSEFP
jgi:hypothetical protein